MKISIMTECWFSLGIAILFGVMGTISMKLSHGFQKIRPIIFLAIFYVISFIAMTFAMKHIELSVVYAIWSGIGTLMVVTVGIFYFDESISVRKFIFLTLIIIGVIGIHLSDGIS